jgi:hypothetical protein
MSEISKLIATFFIWTSFTVIMTSGSSPLNNAGLSGGSAVLAIAFLASAAGASTLAIWIAGAKANREESNTKAKRTRSRVGHFVESLSDDEIAELRARSMADDGEVTSLETLLSAREEERLHRR